MTADERREAKREAKEERLSDLRKSVRARSTSGSDHPAALGDDEPTPVDVAPPELDFERDEVTAVIDIVTDECAKQTTKNLENIRRSVDELKGTGKP